MAGFDFKSFNDALRIARGPGVRQLISRAQRSGVQLWRALEVAGQRRAAAWLGVAAQQQWPHDPALAWDLRRRAARCRAAGRLQQGH